MKKIIYVFLLIICFSFIFFSSYADGHGTNVEYIGNGDEEYTITVPAKMSPNGYGEVVVEGEWASNRVVNVTADESVELVNSINVFNKKTLDVNFFGITAVGDDLLSNKIEEAILIGDLDSQVLFGEWKGTFNYNVEINDSPYNDGYFGYTYSRVFMHELISSFNLPFNIIAHKDMSATFIYADGYVFRSEPDSLIIENGRLYYEEGVYVISEDKLAITLHDPDTNLLLAEWNLVYSNSNVVNTLPIRMNTNDIVDNYRVTFNGREYVKFSDMNLSEKKLLDVKVTMSLGENEDVIESEGVECISNKEVCYSLYWGIPFVISVNEAYAFGEEFIAEPGLYYIDMVSEGVDFEFKLDEESTKSLSWNTQEVKNNKKISSNEYEFVKVSDNIMDEDFFSDSYMNIMIDGSIVSIDRYTTHRQGNNICYFYSYDGGSEYTFVIVITEPGTFLDATFDEVGVYAYNFAEYDKNYNIKIGKKYTPNIKGNLILNNKYIYDDIYFSFRQDEDAFESVLSDNFGNECQMFGNVIYSSDYIGIISKDGKRIKLYKYLSNNWNFDEDEVTFVLEE